MSRSVGRYGYLATYLTKRQVPDGMLQHTQVPHQCACGENLLGTDSGCTQRFRMLGAGRNVRITCLVVRLVTMAVPPCWMLDSMVQQT